MNKKAQVIVREDSRSPVVVKYADTYGPEGIDIRRHFRLDEGGELMPTKKGARVPTDECAEFIAGVLRIAYDVTGDELHVALSAMLSMEAEGYLEGVEGSTIFKALTAIQEAADAVTV